MNIEGILERAPGEIATLADEAEDARFNLERAKTEFKRLEAKIHLQTKAENPELTQSDLRAKVDDNDEVYKSRMDVITFESEYKKCLIKMEKVVNYFTAARKVANLKIEEMRNLSGTITGGK